MPVKKKRAPKKATPKKTITKKSQPNPLIETESLQREIIKSQDKLGKTYAKFLANFKKQRDKFRIKIKQAKEKFSLAKTSYRKANIKTMIKALEEKKKELTHQLDKVSRDYKKFSAQQKIIQKFEKEYEKNLKSVEKKKKKKPVTKKTNSATTKQKDVNVAADLPSSNTND